MTTPVKESSGQHSKEEKASSEPVKHFRANLTRSESINMLPNNLQIMYDTMLEFTQAVTLKEEGLSEIFGLIACHGESLLKHSKNTIIANRDLLEISAGLSEKYRDYLEVFRATNKTRLEKTAPVRTSFDFSTKQLRNKVNTIGINNYLLQKFLDFLNEIHPVVQYDSNNKVFSIIAYQLGLAIAMNKIPITVSTKSILELADIFMKAAARFDYNNAKIWLENHVPLIIQNASQSSLFSQDASFEYKNDDDDDKEIISILKNAENSSSSSSSHKKVTFANEDVSDESKKIVSKTKVGFFYSADKISDHFKMMVDATSKFIGSVSLTADICGEFFAIAAVVCDSYYQINKKNLAIISAIRDQYKLAVTILDKSNYVELLESIHAQYKKLGGSDAAVESCVLDQMSNHSLVGFFKDNFLNLLDTLSKNSSENNDILFSSLAHQIGMAIISKNIPIPDYKRIELAGIFIGPAATLGYK
jgi:hypothetical protein